jgi:methyl-accepting chemotaxis protein
MANFQKIGNRLYLAFAVLIFLEFITVFIGYQQFQTIQVLSVKVAHDQWPKTVIANKIIDNINGNGRSVLALMFLSNSEEMKKAVAQMADASKELTGLYEQLDKTVTDESGKNLLAKIKEARVNYVGNRKKAVDLALSGSTEQAKQILVNETIPLQKIYLNAITDLIGMQGGAMDNAVTNIEQIVSRAITISIGMGIFSLLVAIIMVVPLTRSITRPLSRAVEIAKSVANGKLDNRIEITAGGEAGDMLTTLKHMQITLHTILSEVEECGRHMGKSADQVATISNEISDASKQQESHSEEVIRAMQQLHQISSDVQNQAIEVASRSGQIENMASEGIQSVQHNISSMEETTHQVSRASSEIQELEQSAQQIHNIVKTIKEIAEQTNLLALNAAIEAARAGEQGRGFAVVADEVRKLAERTTKSATEVGNIIGELSSKVLQVATTMDVVVQKVNVTQEEARKTALTIEGMASNTAETAQANNRISSASHQQLEQFGFLESTLETLFSILKVSNTKVDTTANIGQDLRLVTNRLNKIMSEFKFKRV